MASIDSSKLHYLLTQKLKTKGFRAVWQIVGANPNAPKVPCHLVVCSDGNLGGYAFGIKKKIEILRSEGVETANGKIKNFEEKIFKF